MSRVKKTLDHKRIRSLTWLVKTLLILTILLQNVAASVYLSLSMQASGSVSSPSVVLEDGTAGESTIYENGTSALASVNGSIDTYLTYYPGGYNVLYGSYVSGSLPTSVESVDSDFFIVQSSWTSQTSTSYNPSGYSLLGSTTFGSGSVSYLSADDESYMTFNSCASNSSLTTYTRAFIGYGNGTSVTKARTWNGSAWSGETSPGDSGSDVYWVRTAYSPLVGRYSEKIMVTLAMNGYLDAYVWNGSSWMVTNDIASTGVNAFRCFDLAYEKTSGRAMLVYNRGSPYDMRYKIWNGSAWSDAYNLNVTGTPGAATFRWVALAQNPTSGSDELALIAIDGTNDDVYGLIWNGTAWGNEQQLETSVMTTTAEDIAVAYEQTSGYATFVWGTPPAETESRQWNGTGWDASPTEVDLTGSSAPKWFELKPDPVSDRLMLVSIDDAVDLNTAYWNGTAWTLHDEHDNDVNTDTVRAADVVWEPSGSKALLVWGTDGTGGTLLSYKTWNGTDWSSESTFDYAGAEASWVQARRDPRGVGTVKDFIAVSDVNYDGFVVEWNGTAFSDSINFTDSLGSASYENFDLRFQVVGDPTEFTSEVVFTGTSNDYVWTQLIWNIDSAWNTSSVSVTLQLYNYTLGDYSSSGDGYISYTSSSTANTDETKNQTITTNPANFKDSSGNWKVKVKGVKSTGTRFMFKADWIESEPTYYSDYKAYTEFTFSNMTTKQALELNFTVVGRYDLGSVNVTIQIYNYTSSSYVTSGEGYLNYTSSSTPDTDETKILSIVTNPQDCVSSGNAKVNVTCVQAYQFEHKTNQLKLDYNFASVTDYPSSYTVQTGQYVSGSLPTSVTAVDSDYFIVDSSGLSPSTLTYNPGDYSLLGSTSLVSGSTSNLTSDDGVYMVFRSYTSAMVYRAFVGYSNGTSVPNTRTWNSTAWLDETSLGNASSPVRWVRAAYSPLSSRNYEKIIVTLSDDGCLDAYVWNGTAWLTTNNIGNVTSAVNAYRSYDVVYEKTSGDAMLVYSTGGGTVDMNYKIWNGTAWSGANNLNISTTSSGTETYWIALAQNPTSSSNELALISIDGTNSDVYGLIWNGTAWGNEQQLETAVSITTEEDIAVAYEQTSGHAVFVWGSGNNDMASRQWNGTAWDASPTALDPTAANVPNWVTLKPDPASDRLMLVVLDVGLDLNTADWNGTAWTTHTEHDSAVNTHSARCADVIWELSGSKALLVWGTDGGGGTLLSYKTWNGTDWSGESTFDYAGAEAVWVQARRDIGGWGTIKNFIAVSDVNQDGFVVEWNGTALSDSINFTDSLGSTSYENFDLRFQVVGDPTEFTSEVVFTGTSNDYVWTQLLWNIDSAWNTSSVSVTLQLYNYTLGDYPSSGDGYISYTSSSTANTDETKNQTITVNPTHFRNSTGYWQIKIKGVKATGTQFDFKADLIEYKSTHYPEYKASTEFTILDLPTPTPTFLNFTVVNQYNLGSVNVTIQIYNYTSSSYVTSGEGYLNYTSSSTPDTDETKILSIATSPGDYVSSGNAKVNVTCVQTLQFNHKTNQLKLVFKLADLSDHYPSSYTVQTGQYVSGSLPTSVKTIDADYFIVNSTAVSTSTLTYNPNDYSLLGSTSWISGSTSNLTSDDGVYMTFRSYTSAMVYRAFVGYSNGTSVPNTRTWNTTTWSDETSLGNASSPVRWVRAAYSPLSSRNYEKIMVTCSDDAYLDAYVWNGTAWMTTNNIGFTFGGSEGRKYDVVYEKTSGRAMLVYACTPTSVDMNYRIWNGSAWSDAYNLDLNGTGMSTVVDWVALAQNPTSGSNELALIVIDVTNEDVYGMIWNGTAWGNEQQLETAVSITTEEDIAVAYEQTSGHAVFVWGSGNNDMASRQWNGTAWDASPTALDPTAANVPNWVTLKPDPASDRLMLVVLDGGLDLNTADWNGTAWTIHTEHDSAVNTHSARCADVIWELSGSKALLVWGTDGGGGTLLSYKTWNGTAWSGESTFDYAGGEAFWVQARRDTGGWSTVKNFIAVSDVNYDGFVVEWNGTAFSDSVNFTDSLGSLSYENFDLRFQVVGDPTEFTSEVVFTGSSNDYVWTQLVWNVDSAWNTSSVSVNLQLYNYTLGDYPSSGDGYISYTSSSTANTDEMKNQTITVNPTHFRNSTGYWRIKIKGVKATGTSFDFKADLTEYKPTHYSEYKASTEFTLSNLPPPTPTQLTFTVVSKHDAASVDMTIQVYNYSSSSYATTGQGYSNYTSSTTPDTDETKFLFIFTNPQFYTSAGGAKIKVTAQKTTPTQFQHKTNQLRLQYAYGTLTDAEQDYDYVLKVVNQANKTWEIRLKAYSQSNIERLQNCTIYFHNSTDGTSGQIYIESGAYTQQTGPWYNLTNLATDYIAVKATTPISGVTSYTSYIYTYLEIRTPDTSVYARYIITFEIT